MKYGGPIFGGSFIDLSENSSFTEAVITYTENDKNIAISNHIYWMNNEMIVYNCNIETGKMYMWAFDQQPVEQYPDFMISHKENI